MIPTLVLAAWLAAAPPAPPHAPAPAAPAVPDPASLVTRMTDAIQRRDDKAAEALFTPGTYRRPPDSGESFFRQALDKQFELSMRSTLVADDRRARVVVDVARAGKVVDRVFFWAVREGGAWRIGAINEDKYFVQPFLDGMVPVDYFIGARPGSPEFDRLARRLREAASGNEKTRVDVATELAGPMLADALKRLADAPTLAFKSTHVASDLGCALLLFQAPTSTPAYAESLSFVVIRRGGRWQIADIGHGGPSNRIFFSACTKGAGPFPAP